jgi:thymidylate kinase
VFEGPDGVGKSTISAGVAMALRAAGIDCLQLSFPGRESGTLGGLVYGLHHDPSAHGIVDLSSTARQALHVAAHLDVMERVILPALQAGKHVILDRYWWSTRVYGESSGVTAATLEALIEPELRLWNDQPTLVFLVDRAEPINRDEDMSYWCKRRQLYAKLAEGESKRNKVSLLVNTSEAVRAIKQVVDVLKRAGIVDVARTRKAAKGGQLAIDFSGGPEQRDDHLSPSPLILSRIAPAKPTVVLDSYWRFAAERQKVFFRRLEGTRRPWTSDPIIAEHKFTNAYRASDRVSQYLIRNVIYRSDLPQTPEELCFRILLFKLFNKIATWELLEKGLGAVSYKEYSYKHYDQILSKALRNGQRIYSAAYIMPPGSAAFGQSAKHQNNFRLIEMMMRDEVPARLSAARRMQDAFELLRSYPTIGDFLAYQFVTDINYSTVTDFSEMEFVMPGPGALDGIRKCFSGLGGLNEPEIIRLIADIQVDEFKRLGLQFRSLFGRQLQLIDCQNLFCEVDKYARVAHPEFMGRTGRTRIKQKFSPTSEPIDFWYPPKWGINQTVAEFQNAIPRARHTAI